MEIIKSFCANKQEIIDNVEKLREIEEKIRNIAAHEIVSITDDIIRKKTGCNSDDIMERIKKCFAYTGINIKKEYWNSYRDMNEKIIRKLEE